MKKGHLHISLSTVAAGFMCMVIFFSGAFPAKASQVTIDTAKPQKSYQFTAFVDMKMGTVNGDSVSIYPPMKGVHVIGCNIEIPSKFGFEVNWGGKVVRQFKGCPDFIGTEYHGAGTFMVVPQYRPGNTGKMTYKIEVLY